MQTSAQPCAHIDLLETLIEEQHRELELNIARLVQRAPELAAIHEAVEGLASHGATGVTLTNISLLAGHAPGTSQDILVFACGEEHNRPAIVTAVKASGFDVWEGPHAAVMCVHPTGWMLHIDLQHDAGCASDVPMALAA